MTGKLTTHVLDISIGKPASDIIVELWLVGLDNHFALIQKRVTNENGRVDEPFLKGKSMKQGIYEFRFHIGEYYRTNRSLVENPLFLDCIPVRFTISDSSSHYHVPLLISPGGYSTYRGS